MSDTEIEFHRRATRERVGPFDVHGGRFAIECNEPDMAAQLEVPLGDLRAPADPAASQLVVYTVDRHGPAWASHPWGVWRDGTPCETALTPASVIPYVLWEITRLLLENVSPDVPVHAGAIALDGKSVLLVGTPGGRTARLTASLMGRGWGYLSDEVTALRLGGDQVVVEPFWRPLKVRRREAVDDRLGADEETTFVPASSLGSLSPAAPLAAIVLPVFSSGNSDDVGALSPADTLARLTEHLPVRGAPGRRAFTALISVAETLPGHALRIHDLDEADTQLRGLVGSMP
jgi:hypothetical protein